MDTLVTRIQRQLIIEVRHMRIECVKVLLELGADINARCVVYTTLPPIDWTALEAAVLGRTNVNMINFLLEQGAAVSPAIYAFIRAYPKNAPLIKELALRTVLLLQQAREYSKMPIELFMGLFTYLA